jgi:hypothetical protein
MRKYEMRTTSNGGGSPLFVVVDVNSKARFPRPEIITRDRAQAEDVLERVLAKERHRERNRAATRAATVKARAEMRASIDLGDILYTSWGYDQTNVEFFEVVGTYGKFGLVLREIASEPVKDTGPYSGTVRPVPGAFLDEPQVRKTVTAGGVKFASYRYAWPVGDRETFHTSWGG